MLFGEGEIISEISRSLSFLYSSRQDNLEKTILKKLRKPRIRVKITKQHLHNNFLYCI